MKLIICFEDIYNYVTYNIMCNGFTLEATIMIQNCVTNDHI